MTGEEDFDGCARECRKAGVHTLKWGRCERAEEPPRDPPKFGWWRTVDGGDGFLSLVKASLPLVAVVPWAAVLSVDEQHRMLEEAADGEDPAGVIERWRRIAEARADGGEEWGRLVAETVEREASGG